MRSLWSRARTREDGMGLVELIIAMTILTVGLLAILATFSSGMTTLARSSRTASASTLADSQLQLYRAITYCAIRLRTGSIPATAPYTNEPGYNASATVTDTAPGSGSCGATTLPCPAPPSTTLKECEATRIVTGPEGRPYRIDAYIVTKPVGARETKKVTVVVRDPQNGDAVLTRHVSLFDRLLG